MNIRFLFNLTTFTVTTALLVTGGALLLTPSKILASGFSLSQTFTMPDVTDRDRFGWSVAMDGSNVLIGAPANNSNGRDVGRAYLFDTATGSLSQTFTMPDVTDGDLFGYSVAIEGSKVLIGAPFNDSEGDDVGRAYLFDAMTGSLSQTFTMPDVTDLDNFGRSVALDGSSVLIGAPLNDSEGDDVGRAYLFDAMTGSLSQTFTMPDVTEVDQFGLSVALDGNRGLVGARANDSDGTNVGRAYLFDALTGDLTQTFTMPDVTDRDNFGRSVAIDGISVLIGAPRNDSEGNGVGRAYLFNVLTGNLSQTFTMPDVTSLDQFGFSVALDGKGILIGAPFNNSEGDGIGRTYLYQVPEPLTILGAGTAAGFGAFFKRTLAKKQRQQQPRS